MKFNGKCKIRLLRDFPAINLRMGDSLTVYKYKYKKCSDEITYVHPRTYEEFLCGGIFTKEKQYAKKYDLTMEENIYEK